MTIQLKEYDVHPRTIHQRCGALALFAALILSPAISFAQNLGGQAGAVQATVFGLLGSFNVGLANTGTLTGPTDARQASDISGNLLGALLAEVPHATAIGLGDSVASQASLANLALSIAGSAIGADLVMAEAQAANGVGSGTSTVTNLVLNGVPVAISGEPNQVVGIPGGQMIINQQQSTPGGIVVNALHVIVGGVADVVIGTATATAQ